MKKFVNRTESCVDEGLKGLVLSRTGIGFHQNNKRIVVRRDVKALHSNNVVSLICGGGSGHEPFAAGFVGPNSLSAAICGDLFASPPSSNVFDAIQAAKSDAGIIVFVINYTGDRLNFGVAVERTKSECPNLPISLIYIDDDVALEQKELATGNRGIAGASLVIHIVGVFAEHFKMNFNELNDMAHLLIRNTATFGVTLYPCALPGHGRMFELGESEFELGLGIHGESGIERCKFMACNEICEEVLRRLTSSKRLNLQKEDEITVLINNLGSTSQLEMGILKSEIVQWLLSSGYNLKCIISGTLMTSIDSHGFSVTILKLCDPRWLECLLGIDSAISKHWEASNINKELMVQVEGGKLVHYRQERGDEQQQELGPAISDADAHIIKRCIQSACKTMIEKEEELNRLDRTVGDGDCGTSLRNAANVILGALDNEKLLLSHPKSLFLQISKLFEQSIGGTSGAIYALMFNAAANAIDQPLCSAVLKKSLKLALEKVEYYGGARPGHRTLVDPLDAAANSKSEDWEAIIISIEKKAKDTASMEAKAGRASYTFKDHQMEPDPGALALSLWFRAIFEEYKESVHAQN